MVAQVHVGRYDTQVQCSGTIQPKAEQAISFGLPLKPTAIHVAVGDTVHAGQVLMDIDRTQSIAAFAQNNSQSSMSSTSSSSSTAASGANSDTARIQQAIRDWAASHPSQNSTNDMNALLQQYAQYAGTSEASQIESQLSSQLSQSAGASNDTDSASHAESTLEQQVPEQILAPISGVVTQLNASVGSFCTPTTNLLVISDLSGLNMCAQVNQSDISKVHVGQKAQISTSDSKTTGTVTKISPNAHSVSDANGTKNVVDVLIGMTEANKNMLPDMDAQATITTNSNPNAVSIPYEAVQQDDSGQEYVFLLRNHHAYRQNIQTGAELSTTVQVLAGLQRNETVVLSPQSDLKSGMPVQIKGIRHV